MADVVGGPNTMLVAVLKVAVELIETLTEVVPRVPGDVTTVVAGRLMDTVPDVVPGTPLGRT
jgi:hypothetical protein